jgi:hypothetical protein
MRLRSLLFTAAVFVAAPLARAEETGTKGTFTLPPVTIVGRIQKPIATVDVNRVGFTLPMRDLKSPSAAAITESVRADPF